MTYRHLWADGSDAGLPAGKAVCVGRNYAAHAHELGNAVPDSPILFIKPATSLVNAEPAFAIPTDRGACHFETEITVLIGSILRCADPLQAAAAVCGLGIALDLTLRDIQNELKAKGHPWERAKAFDGACPLGRFTPCDGLPQQALEIRMHCNGELRQQGSSTDMLFPIPALLAHMSQVFTLLPGDIVLTGTPAGVGPLQAGDQLDAEITGWANLNCAVSARPGAQG